MISYDRSSGSRGLWLVAGAVAVGVAGAAWWWSQSGPSDAAPAPSTAASAASSAAPVVNLSKPAEVLPDGRPSDFSAEEWGALKDAVGNKPDGVKELQRITAFLRYQKGFEQWQTMQESANVAERHALARQLLEQLPDRISNMEMTMGESLMICAALIADLESEEAQRVQKIESCKTTLEARAPKLDTEQALREAECRTEFLRRQAALVAEFQALPAAQKDHTKFERDVEAMRRDVYGSPTCGR